jgi:hypothetical protein
MGSTFEGVEQPDTASIAMPPSLHLGKVRNFIVDPKSVRLTAIVRQWRRQLHRHFIAPSSKFHFI